MYELIRLTEHDYYIDCPAKMGLVDIGDGKAVLIDSGSDKDAGKKALKILQEKGWTLSAVFNTHSHADHIGGNRFLQEKTGCAIYAKGLECVFSNDPVLEPMTLNGGKPHKDLRHKFLMAKESSVQPLTADVLPEGLEILELPGHSFDMAGFLTKDGTAYIADSVSSAETLAKYGLGYLWDYEASLRTLDYLESLNAKRFVPAHAEVTEDIAPLAELNKKSLTEARDKILDFCAEPVSFEDLLKKMFDAYGMAMNAQQYVLIGSTVRSYLSSLYDCGVVSCFFEDNRMLWQRSDQAL